MSYPSVLNQPSVGSTSTYFTPGATEQQREEIRALGGQPPEYLSQSQAKKAIAALKSRARRAANRLDPVNENLPRADRESAGGDDPSPVGGPR